MMGFLVKIYKEERFILLLEGLKDNNCASTINKNIGQGLSYEDGPRLVSTVVKSFFS